MPTTQKIRFRVSLIAGILGLFTVAVAYAATADATQSLAGKWVVRLDPGLIGEKENWAAQPLAPASTVHLPGSLTSNGIGDDVGLTTPWMGDTSRGGWLTDKRYEPYRQPGNIKVPFWLQPDKYYKGAAWYQRTVEIPAQWAGKRIVLNLERCHWKTTVYVDGKSAGAQDSLCVPHRYELSSQLMPGQHLLTVCVDNRYHIRVGHDASSVTDHTQTNWNGIAGEISLTATAPVWIEDLQAYPDLKNRTVRVTVQIKNSTGKPFNDTLALAVESFNSATPHRPEPVDVPVKADAPETTIEAVLPLGPDAQTWDEFSPALYRLRAVLEPGSDPANHSEKTVQFGLRELRTEGRAILVNGRPIFLRGTLDCGAFPKTGYPSTDVAEWRRIFGVCKAYGLNHVRYHSWCPPEAAFAAADLEGIYLQVEGPVWRGNCPYKDAAPVEPFLVAESERICRAYGNHPSFLLFSHGNEPWELDKKWLSDSWVPAMKKLDPRHLVTAGSHFPISDSNDYHVAGTWGGYGFKYRYYGSLNLPPDTIRNYEDQTNRKSAPAVAHETGEWCVFPNLREIRKYTGCLKAKNFEIVRDFMYQNHLLDQADDFLLASGKFQTLLYKEECEAYHRTRGSAGYQLLGLNDFPGQGTALVGVVDAFWEDKGYVTPEEFKRFSGPVVPLALMEKRVWTSSETFTAKIRVSQYSAGPLRNAVPAWRIINSRGREIAAGKLATSDIPVGNSTELGSVTLPLAAFTQADKLTLHVTLPGTPYRNEWNFWVYPEQPARDNGNVVVCHTRDEALAALAKGGAVLLLPKPATLAGKTFGTFAPIFWNKAWFPGQKEHTLGLLINPRHPALAGFPTDFYADWQWWDLMNHSKPMVLDSLPPTVRSIVQPIDDWNTCRRLGLLLEARIGGGKLMIASIDLENGLDKRPVARQLRDSLLAYMNSTAFKPEYTLDEAGFTTLFSTHKSGRLIARVEADSASTGENSAHPAAAVVDGDPGTFWHSDWEGTPTKYPHELRLELTQAAKLSGINLLPRQDGNTNGWVKDVEILASLDGTAWTTVTKTALANNQEWKAVTFPAVQAKFLKIRMLTPQKPAHPWASFAEIDLTSQP